MLQVISLLLENKPGALMRVTGLLSQRGYNIESLTVARTLDPELSRMTIAVDVDAAQRQQVIKQMNKLINVLQATDLTDLPAVVRELVLVRIRMPQESRTAVLKEAEIFGGRVVDSSTEGFAIEATGDPEKLGEFIDVMSSYGEIEVTRSGALAIGLETKKLRLQPPVPTKAGTKMEEIVDFEPRPGRPLGPSGSWSIQMSRRFYEKDGNLEYLNGRTVAIIGYGSQGHAHALNLRDSGVDVVVSEAPGSPSWAKAEAAGLKVMTTAEAAKVANVIMILVPDHVQAAVYNKDIAPHMTPGKTLMFAHGFNIHFKQIAPPPGVDVSMIAPKAPGHRVRELYTEGVGVPALVAVEQNATGQALERALAYALALGCLKAGVIETTFKEETESDLFGEQAVLCGGASELIRAGFETLVAAGYAPEIAYFECLHELKLIVDLIQEGGLAYMRFSVSDTAEYGDYTRGPRMVNEQTRAEMRKILSEIQSGEFARQWIEENRTGRKNFLAMREAARHQPIETVGRELREMMPFLKKKKEAGVPTE